MTSLTQEAPAAMITVQTLFKGAVEVEEHQLISFVTPLLGFPHLKRFLIYQTQLGPTYWLQAVDDPKIGFCLLAPFQAGLDPDLELSGDDVADIGAHSPADLDVYNVVVLDANPDQRRANLRAPILVCRSTNLAKQVVLSDTRLPIRFYLRDLKDAGR
jgi:flagellar assembly factor FliW